MKFSLTRQILTKFESNDLGVLGKVTTNPSLMAKENIGVVRY